MSRSRIPLPSGWAKTVQRIVARDNGICHVCGGSGATEADHIIPRHLGGSNADRNLAAIHHDCHLRKTAREANAAKPKRQRPSDPHPGLIGVEK